MSRPRIRAIKPEIWHSRDFQALSPVGRLTFLALISNADDEGRLKTDPGHLATTYLPGCHPDEIAAQLELMETRRMAMQYGQRGARFVAVLGWSKHQRVSHAVGSELPEPPRFKRKGAAQQVLLTEKQGKTRNSSRGDTTNKRQPELDSLRRAPEDSGTNPVRSGPVRSRSGPDPVSVSTELTLLPADLSGMTPVDRIFEAWRLATGHQRTVLDDRRAQVCRARLKEGWSVEDLILVVTEGWRNDPWNERRLHNQFEILLRNSSQVETFLGYATKGAPVLAPRKSNLELGIEADLDRARQLREEGL